MWHHLVGKFATNDGLNNKSLNYHGSDVLLALPLFTSFTINIKYRPDEHPPPTAMPFYSATVQFWFSSDMADELLLYSLYVFSALEAVANPHLYLASIIGCMYLDK